MSRWYEEVIHGDDPGQGPTEGRLFAEVGHRTGNLVHKMYYWAGVLEDESGSPEAAEAVAELRNSLGELHGMIARTMDLMKPVSARPMMIRLDELLESMCGRIGAACDKDDPKTAEVLGVLSEREALIDPMQLERSLAMFKEAFELRTGTDSNDPSFPLTVRETPDCRSLDDPEASVEIVCTAEFARRPGERDSVAGEVGIALAIRLLEIVGWTVCLEDDEISRTLTISVPLSTPKHARKSSDCTDSDNPQTRLNA